MSGSRSHSDRRSRRGDARLIGCLLLSFGVHAIGALALSGLSFSEAPAEAPQVAIDAGAHSVRVALVRAPAPVERVLKETEPNEPTPAIDMPPVEPVRSVHSPPDPIELPAPRAIAMRMAPTATSAFGIEAPVPERLKVPPKPEAAHSTERPQPQPDPAKQTVPAPPIDAPAPDEQTAASRNEDAGSVNASLKGTLSPGYPTLSRRRGEQGLVVLDVRVLADGSVGEIRVLRDPGPRRLVEAAIDAVRAAEFSPATRNGEPVASWLETPVRFALK